MEFNKVILKLQKLLRLIGFSSVENGGSKILHIQLNPVIYCINFVFLIMFLMTLSAKACLAVISGNNIFDSTILIAGAMFSLVGVMKSLTVLYYTDDINELIRALESLQTTQLERDDHEKALVNKHVSILINIFNKTLYLFIMGVVSNDGFSVLYFLFNYFKTGEVLLRLPFVAYYPFDEYNVWIYPFVYLQQLWSGQISRMSMYIPDCLFFTFCTFIHIEFLLLQYNIERIVPEAHSNESLKTFNLKFLEVVERHQELIRCSDLLEKIYSKITWCNMTTSSIIICVTGFNAMFQDNIYVIAHFASFMAFTLLQIFLVCYFGDNIKTSSSEVGGSVSQSRWYNVGAKSRKGLLTIMTRTVKACELTAYGFFVIDLRAFSKVLSTSWSYFALLRTMYDQ